MRTFYVWAKHFGKLGATVVWYTSSCDGFLISALWTCWSCSASSRGQIRHYSPRVPGRKIKINEYESREISRVQNNMQDTLHDRGFQHKWDHCLRKIQCKNRWFQVDSGGGEGGGGPVPFLFCVFGNCSSLFSALPAAIRLLRQLCLSMRVESSPDRTSRTAWSEIPVQSESLLSIESITLYHANESVTPCHTTLLPLGYDTPKSLFTAWLHCPVAQSMLPRSFC